MFSNQKNTSGSPVQIAIAPDETVASIWKNVLESNGVPCFLKSINLVESIYLSPFTLRYQLMVRPEDAGQALELLAPFLANQPEEQTECGNSNIEREKENQG